MDKVITASGIAVCVILAVLFPGVGVVYTLAVAVLCLVAGRMVLKVTGNGSGEAYAALSAVWTLMAAGLVLNLHGFTAAAGGTDSHPVLMNNDALLAWESVTGGDLVRHFAPRSTYGLFLRLVTVVCGPSLLIFLGINVVASVSAVALCGAITRCLLPGHRHAAVWGIALTGAVAYFVSESSLLLKDSLCALAFALALWGLVGCKNRIHSLVCILAGMVLMGWMRAPGLPMLAIAIVVVGYTPGKRMTAVSLAALALVAWCAVRLMLNTDPTGAEYGPKEADNLAGRLGVYQQFVTGYAQMPLWQRLLQLPMALAVQYLTPLPWNWTKHIVYGWSTLWAHFSYPWYIVGGMYLYALGCWKSLPRTLLRVSLCALVLNMGVAFVTGGTVSRYILMLLPAIVPAAAWTALVGLHRPSFKYWAVAYTVALAAALVWVYIYSPGSDHVIPIV